MKINKSVQGYLFLLMDNEYDRERILNEEYKMTSDKRAISIYNKYIVTNKGYQAAVTNNYGGTDRETIKDIISFLNEEEKIYKPETFLFIIYHLGCDCTIDMLLNKYPFIQNCGYDLKNEFRGLAIDFPKLLYVAMQKDLDNINLKA